MSTPINLNKARKARTRLEKRAQADANALKFGRSKAEKDGAKAEVSKLARHVDSHKRDT